MTAFEVLGTSVWNIQPDVTIGCKQIFFSLSQSLFQKRCSLIQGILMIDGKIFMCMI